jgi:UDP-N-acetylmuramoyl-tripeptide--D-alanyl-D-alanine ligase
LKIEYDKHEQKIEQKNTINIQRKALLISGFFTVATIANVIRLFFESIKELKMIVIPLSEAYVAVGGRPTKPVTPFDFVNKTTQNSNEVESGTLFVALRGNRVDGHDFVKEAKDRGAIGAIVESHVLKVDLPQFIVPSTEEALGQLAKIWRGKINIPLVAVAGSVGKTSTKDIISHVLSTKYNTHRSRKNFNNQLGVPIELLNLNRSHNCSVVEFGMRGVNQINYLSKIARPTIGVITNIGMSHIEKLGSIEEIAKAKIEILEGLDSEGILVLNADDKYFNELKKQAHCKVVSYGESDESDYRISDIHIASKGSPVFRINGIPISINGSIGKHHAYNAGAAFAVASRLGVKPEEISKLLSTYITPERRGVFSRANCGAILLDNTYNAAPDSIKASLYTLADVRTKGARTVAVIGEMLELGEYSEEAHRYLGDVIAEIGIDVLVTVGDHAKFIGENASLQNWEHCDNASIAANFLLSEVTKDDVILLQASRDISLDIVVDSLEKGTIELLRTNKTKDVEFAVDSLQ